MQPTDRSVRLTASALFARIAFVPRLTYLDFTRDNNRLHSQQGTMIMQTREQLEATRKSLIAQVDQLHAAIDEVNNQIDVLETCACGGVKDDSEAFCESCAPEEKESNYAYQYRVENQGRFE